MRRSRSTAIIAEALATPAACARQSNGPNPQGEQFVPIARGSATISPIAQLPGGAKHVPPAARDPKGKGKGKDGKGKGKGQGKSRFLF